REHLRLPSTFTNDDDYILRLISSARDHVERYCARYWASANFIWTVESLGEVPFGTGLLIFNMPRPYVTAIIEIAYLDSDDVAQTVGASEITLDEERQRVTIPDTITGHDWRIKFTAGADEDQNDSDVAPDAIKEAILLLLGDAYENRQAQVLATSIAENPAAKALMHDYRENMGI
ncbi:MAG: hypothetical protein GWM98_15380, partial [Nitrospinaceae bacterium]|nr:phage gp6-like head-tail connector protein [Nitrospinaceae bacterium]NIR55606.1 phage gp6-like head-tail connector protein [Nitrospinaceae bacterium]NIS86040.1 phage gp6-like head-tail connector protein [Nitrospinaceae bacterium]NIT82883.1 phage gp6-like head-tail connector protein [Nitrospinaceae bacterium]NIU45088.1 phage gp6-like head-tail connector protein [Nitrospinaceae bacterium]